MFETTIGPVTIQAIGATRIFEYVPLRGELNTLLGWTDPSLVLFFATRIDIQPGIDRLPFGIGRDRIMDEARPAITQGFREELAANNIQNILILRTTEREVAGGVPASITEYSGTIRLAGDFRIQDTVVRVDESVPVSAVLAVWHDGTDIIVAGGSYPSVPLNTAISAGFPRNIPLSQLGIDTAVFTREPDSYAAVIDSFIPTVLLTAGPPCVFQYLSLLW